MTSLRTVLPSIAMLTLGLASGVRAQALDPFYSGTYTLANLGTVPGAPAGLSALLFDPANPDTLFIGVNSNLPQGALHKITVRRDAGGRITSFFGQTSQRSTAPQIDGGLCVGPNGVLFYACYPTNEVGQITPASVGPLKTTRLGTVGIDDSIGAIRFVPAGFPGAGRMKLASYTTGQWYDVDVSRDGTSAGTWNFNASTEVPDSGIAGGAGSFFYVDPAMAKFERPSLLASEFDFRAVSAYELTPNGDPIPSTRRPFLTGVVGIQGAVVDPVTGDFLFSSLVANEVLLVSRPTSNIRLSGAVELADFVADPKDRLVTVQFRRTTDSALIETQVVRLFARGGVQVTTGLTGTFDVHVKSSHWLSAVVRKVRLGSGTSVGHTFSLVNGDVNGDNTVNANDFLAVRAAFGSRAGNANWNANADLNGDGAVSVQDFLIVRKNFGRTGG